MSATGPKDLREIARHAAQRAIHLGKFVVLEDALREHWPEIGTGTTAEYFDCRSALAAEYDRIDVALSQPDEPPAAEFEAEFDSAFARIQATRDRHAARGTHGGEYRDDDIRSILAGRRMWKRAAEAAGAEHGTEFQLGHGGAWCTACRRPMREGTPVVKVPTVVCTPCGALLAETAGRLDPSRLAAEQQHDDGYDGGCDDCLCCTRTGCHTRSDATCPTNQLGESVCPCTGE